jgi:hypothetical protein
MASLTLTSQALAALAAWNQEQVGRGVAAGTLRPDGRFDVAIDDEVAARLEQLRMPGESDDALICGSLVRRARAARSKPNHPLRLGSEYRR